MSIKGIIRKSSILRRIKTIGETNIGRFCPQKLSEVRFIRSFGRKPNYKNPTTLNDKLMYYKFKLYWNNKLVSLCADKYRVREYVEECGCQEILNELYGVWDCAEKIRWSDLPRKFAIKCNHGSGFNIICKDKETFNKNQASQKLNTWLNTTYGYINAEQGIYSGIERRIIAERFIETPDDLPPNDYKFFCSYGRVFLLFVACDRYEGKTKFDYYYPDWTWIPVQNAHPNKGAIPKPGNLEKMIAYAEKLSKPFPLVRVDFYDVADKVIFGELTFTHFGCVTPFTPQEYDRTFGELFPSVFEASAIHYKGHLI